ncbi:uncharacterized protein SPPG_05896 [Spizellomyces punctatus DAOM BR117]|uniref:Histone chaperone domain-containing protein n=1 Tax=Spizellomyces punctatus (strain DAOM BR117) TaxID=645134 RepID=A0A0L0HD83_SPIPD|nr:uncharacterized protein SPPG_05896 [Spizellomyces punctatus DAOM BR117]KNC98934.1 hypothetical protein SPPG_05896 [Spizellomyces punctatus DAOM BR117]|eukprot:XP_016606974.1 hypothetical protein SPPG_05896 [Spizellomyces punctatus DAOM BR117]
MLATTEPEVKDASLEVDESTKPTIESLKAAAAPAIQQEVPKDEEQPKAGESEQEEESEEDEDKMEVDDEDNVDFEEEDLVEIDAANIIETRTRGVKIDFANLPEEEKMEGEEDDEDDEDVVLEDE